MNTIFYSPKDLVRKKKCAPVLIDIRSEGEFFRGRIPGAFNIPYEPECADKFEKEVVALTRKYRDRNFVLYCSGGSNSLMVLRVHEKLKNAGVKTLYLGYNGYLDAINNH
ncbi:MAG: rhodanese-like domain-containing protein [Lachnospiraceae bacterium]|nr:rhodanese-like domain-containing protein [Lachnospiraceae bacterium]